MKKLLSAVVLAVMALVMMPADVYAQGQATATAGLPTDPDVRIGHLPNGLTYYIRHNELPKGLADFYIAQKVGSILEEENQRGLAHFLEHMCFNGTTNFPDNLLRDWLESIGVKFGADLNAYTAVDQTVYNISNVPVSRESVQDSCLLILHDWANDLTLDPKEIDKERGVIHQEWRRSMQGQMRIMEKILPEFFPGSKYGERLPIGIMEVVDNFPPKALRDYYETWYRPDQQAVIVVGDIDPDRIEAKIKEMFGPIEMPANPKARVYEPVPDHEGYLFGIGSDPEQKQFVAQLMFLREPVADAVKNTPAYFVDSYIKYMVSQMLSSRLQELASKADAPFAGAGAGFGDYVIAKTKDAMLLQAVARGGDIVGPLQAAYRELLRAARNGFTQSEYDRVRSNYISSFESVYNNRASRQNSSFVNEYVNNFLDSEPIPGIDVEWNLAQQIAANVTLADINRFVADAVTPGNRAVMVMAPEKEGITVPTSEAIRLALTAVDNEQIDAFVDNVKSEPLIATAPVPGKIIKSEENKVWGTTEWTLSNGAKVIVKPTKFKESEIIFAGQALGGYADYPAEYAPTLKNLSGIISTHGLGNYNSQDLDKYLAGKMASAGVSVDAYTRSVSGASTPKDLPTLMELVYMTFTGLTVDPEEFAAWQKKAATNISNQMATPNYVFSKNIMETLYDSPLQRINTVEDVNAASREEAVSIVHDQLSNAADFTFVFVGNVDPDTLRPLVETYLASLPGDVKTSRRGAPTFNPAMFAKGGVAENDFTTKMTTPQTFVTISEFGNMDYTPKNVMLASIAGQILTNRLIKTVREEMGAVYSISASGSGSRLGLNPFTLGSSFPMKPEMKREVLDFFKGQVKEMESNVTDDELNPIKEYMVKSFTDGKEHNGPWRNALLGYSINGVDTFNGNVDVVNSITVKDVMDYMKALNAQGNYRVLTLDPAE